MAGRRWFRRKVTGEPVAPTTDAEWEVISAQVAQDRDDRKRALDGQESLVAEVSEILFETDLIGLNFEDNTDEYDTEAETIVIRLPEASGPRDVQRIAHEEFSRWFDPTTAGNAGQYSEVAALIWDASQRRIS